MNPTKSLQLAGVLALASLIHISSATAQDEEIGNRNEGILEPGIKAKDLEVTSQHLAVLSRRLADAEALDDLNASIAEIHKVIQDLIEERKRWRVEQERIANTITAVRREIRDVNDDIDDIEDAIIAGVHDRGDGARRHGPNHAAQEACRPDAARQGDDGSAGG